MRKDAYGLTPFELAMYLAQIADPSSTEYSVDCYFDISGSNKDAVHSAVSDMIRSHEILHSRYDAGNGMPVRILTDDYPQIHWTTAPSPDAVREQALISNPNAHRFHEIYEDLKASKHEAIEEYYEKTQCSRKCNIICDIAKSTCRSV